MIKSLTPKWLQNSGESDDDFDKAFQPLIIDSNVFFVALGEPTESKQEMQAKSNISDSFYYPHEFQMTKTHDLREYREFDRSLTPKMADNKDHLEQVRRFILKNGFQEPMIISYDLKTGNAYITEDNHRLWVAHKEGIPSIPCCVIPH